MENPGRYLIVVKIKDGARENAFFSNLQEIDPHPLNVVGLNVLAIKSKLSVSEIFNQLKANITTNDTLIIVGMAENACEAKSSDFQHWWTTGRN